MKIQGHSSTLPTRPLFWTEGLGHYAMGEKYGRENPRGYSNRHCIFLTISGQGAYQWKRRSFVDNPRTLTIMNDVPSPMNWRSNHPEWDFYWMIIRGPGLLDWARQFDVKLPILAQPVHEERLPDLINRFDILIQNMKLDCFGNHIPIQRDCFDLFSSLLEAMRPLAVHLPSVYGKNLMKEVHLYLQRPNPAPDRLDEFAERIHASAEHISRVFKIATGLSPKEYFLRFRIQQAQRMLRNTSLSIAEIGQQTGYADPQHFSRLFRNHAGVTATNYRKRGVGF